MKREYLFDLDELVLSCHSTVAREAISEAIACYRAGAFRSCIVSTWNAVVWDYLDKLRFLEANGDNQAKAIIEKWERNYEGQTSQDITELLQFEREIMEKAAKPFEFISEAEKIDLERLKEDRNRCAHPSFSRPEEIYRPNAELARTHLVHAVEHFLKNPPTQGKQALNELLNRIIAPYSPDNYEDFKTFLKPSAIAHPKESMLRNFVCVLLKSILLGTSGTTLGEYNKWAFALKATHEMHHERTGEIWKKELPTLLRRENVGMLKALWLLDQIPELWSYWPPDMRKKWELYILNPPESSTRLTIFYAMSNPSLKATAIDSINNLDEKTLNRVLTEGALLGMEEALSARAVDIYSKSSSYDEAKRLGRGIVRICVPFLNVELISKILHASKENSQIGESNYLEPLLRYIRSSGKIEISDFDVKVKEAGFEIFAESWQQMDEVNKNVS